MRLRYLHLQNYPPISDINVCFASGSPLGRNCAIRFVVGLNGSGKSNLLRAVAEVFLALSDLRVPPFPVSLIYELGIRGSKTHRTLLLHCPGTRSKASLWLHESFVFDDQNGQEVFETCVEHLELEGMPSVPGFSALIKPGHWPLRNTTPPLIALPSAVLAYTTGELRPWLSVWNRNQDAQGLLEDMEESLADERPAGWTKAQELAIEAARKETGGIERSDRETAAREVDSFRRPILLDATLLKCALLAVALPHALKGSAQQDAALQNLLERGSWHHLVSVGFRSHLQANSWDRKLCETAHDWWLCAGEVIAEPHPIETRRTLLFDLKGTFSAQELATRVATDALVTCATQGEALLALLGGADVTPFELFTRLLELNQSGLFDDVLLRLRIRPVPEPGTDNDGQDIGVLRYEELSDGEQMVLGRMALFHLLDGQQDALLLLDEPETHFNDKWKREIVDIIDEAIGNTANDVLISTHSAIVLTDVFSEEIILLEKQDYNVQRITLSSPTFGADPGEVMMRIFDSPDSVGKRAQEWLDNKEWAAMTTEELETFISKVGPGFYRTELRTLLNERKRNA
ncbi:hypothetical protein Geob_2866 [Geotalea daltonii FRC-32]|uniref:ATPase AAA-type core domain-containing protein n=1 Tax=Geotalea daltonii (strain DSM 22248 / JCM 15807 / FRC-32) TaxID=316067 RepID=B9M292_GEODF|nr:AAA family ATPase [Geotalea daltonii]ACM21210.1 hypothetical protein Geob_2866 [Geotalea daltonii FRC-32]